MEAIDKFLLVSDGYGYGDGSGDGSGSGSGYGDGDGSGYGSGYGDGSGDGDGSGSGYGYGVLKHNGRNVYMIDGVQTIIYSVKSNYAKGATLNADLTLTPCYIAKVGDFFAHGETLKKAFEDAQQKYASNLSDEERIKMFKSQFEKDKSYPAKLFFEWHNTLTGSCEFGRRAFCRQKGVDIEKDSFTVLEFLKLTENEYGGSIIKKLINEYKKQQ